MLTRDALGRTACTSLLSVELGPASQRAPPPGPPPFLRRRQAWLLWFRICISLGPFMLDPWEKMLYFLCVVGTCGLLVSAVLRAPAASAITSAVAERCVLLGAAASSAVSQLLLKLGEMMQR